MTATPLHMKQGQGHETKIHTRQRFNTTQIRDMTNPKKIGYGDTRMQQHKYRRIYTCDIYNSIKTYNR